MRILSHNISAAFCEWRKIRSTFATNQEPYTAIGTIFAAIRSILAADSSMLAAIPVLYALIAPKALTALKALTVLYALVVPMAPLAPKTQHKGTTLPCAQNRRSSVDEPPRFQLFSANSIKFGFAEFTLVTEDFIHNSMVRTLIGRSYAAGLSPAYVPAGHLRCPPAPRRA